MDRKTYIKIRSFFILSPIKRTKYLIKNKVFRSVGNSFYFCPRKIPQDPMLIRFGNNVKVATDVLFITHDIIHDMVNDIKPSVIHMELCKEFGIIDIRDNVFIGANSTILPNVTIGPNVIVAAGSVVTRSFSGGVIIGGNPAKVIGSVDTLIQKRVEINKKFQHSNKYEQEAERLWKLWDSSISK